VNLERGSWIGAVSLAGFFIFRISCVEILPPGGGFGCFGLNSFHVAGKDFQKSSGAVGR
jgi:hypothetical protein